MIGLTQIYTADLAATGGTAKAFVVPAAPQGAINRIVLKQLTDGTKAGYTFQLYCSNKAFSALNTTTGTFTLAADADKYRVTPVLSVAASSDTYEAFGLLYGYRNVDDVVKALTEKNKLYLVLTPAGTGAKTFLFATTIESPELIR